MKRTVTDADVKALWEDLAPVIIGQFHAKGAVLPSIVGVDLNEKGAIRHSQKVPQDIIDLLFDGPSLSDRRRRFLRGLVNPAEEFAVDVAVMVSEAWYVNRDAKVMNDDAIERVTRDGVSAQPDRQEAICIVFHTATLETCGFCPIDPKTRKANIGMFLMQPFGKPAI
jgi:hypothetical protein